MGKRRGLSYQKRVADINRIYDQHIKVFQTVRYGAGSYILSMLSVSVNFTIY